MSAMEKTTRHSTRFNVAKSATESEAVISRGEQVLERAHRVAHDIEEHVRRLLDVYANAGSFPSTDRKSSNTSQE